MVTSFTNVPESRKFRSGFPRPPPGKGFRMRKYILPYTRVYAEAATGRRAGTWADFVIFNLGTKVMEWVGIV